MLQPFEQIQCAIAGHNQYMVCIICVDKNCKESKLVCNLCFNAHKSHISNLLTIAEFQKLTLELKNKNQSNINFNRLQKMVDDFETLTTTKLKELVSELKQLLNVTSLIDNILVQQARSYSQLLSQFTQLLQYVEMRDGEIKFNILQPSDIFPKIKDKLTKYLQYVNNFWNNNAGNQENEQILQLSIQNQTSQFQQSIQQPLLKLQTLNLNKINKSYQQLNSEQILIGDLKKKIKFLQQDHLDSYKFTPDFCSQSIKCISPRCVQKTSVNIANDVACLNKPLSQYEKQSFFFRINRLKGYIGLGISIIQSVEANNFMFGPLDEVGHGVYMVLNNGLVYNNNYPKYNRIIGQIEFTVGQKYRLTFDPLNKEGKQFTIQTLSQKKIHLHIPCLCKLMRALIIMYLYIWAKKMERQNYQMTSEKNQCEDIIFFS